MNNFWKNKTKQTNCTRNPIFICYLCLSKKSILVQLAQSLLTKILNIATGKKQIQQFISPAFEHHWQYSSHILHKAKIFQTKKKMTAEFQNNPLASVQGVLYIDTQPTYTVQPKNDIVQTVKCCTSF